MYLLTKEINERYFATKYVDFRKLLKTDKNLVSVIVTITDILVNDDSDELKITKILKFIMSFGKNQYVF